MYIRMWCVDCVIMQRVLITNTKLKHKIEQSTGKGKVVLRGYKNAIFRYSHWLKITLGREILQ